MKQFLHAVATDQVNGGAVFIVKGALWILSQVYRFLVALRMVSYKIGILKRYKLPCPVISVGNLTVGGVGKTPLVEFIAWFLKEKKVRPAILIRGYMGERANIQGRKSDEAAMLEDALSDVPVLVGSDRVKSAKIFLEQNKADVFLLDDGFQHWPLSRDVDIVAIDATNPWGNGCLLPRGILRESKSALLRAHMFVLTKTDLGARNLPGIKNDLKRINPGAPVVETIHRPVSFVDMRFGSTIDLESIKKQKVCAVCSIGAPDTFSKTLINLGADIAESFAFIDHYSYERADIKRIIKSCEEQDIVTIVTTQKDVVKLKPFLGAFPEHIRVLSLRIKISVTHGEDVFLERINHIL